MTGNVGIHVSGDPVITDERRRQIREAAKAWSGQLIDLGGRNQLLYYRDLKVGTLDLADAQPEAVDLLLDGRAVRISRMFSSETRNDRLKRARAIRNKSREALEERGIVTCFLAIGMATWTNNQGSATPAAPILLREAAISAVGASEDDFELSLTGETDVNPTLLHFLRDQFHVDLPDDLDLLVPAGRFDPSTVYDRIVKECADVPGFTITGRRILGTFSYAKLPMVSDLNANQEALVVHEVVAAISGNREAQVELASAGGVVGLADPDHTPPPDEFLVLDADSSQSYAINAVVSGQSVVVSGPPGTGKSQTIANLIATSVARGQSVLFVAEKRAAIAAVLDRLSRVGLADLVLDLHAGVGSRRAFAANLAAGLRAAAAVPRPDQAELHERLSTRRERLNAHDDAMHRRRVPWNVSLFEAQSELVGLHGRYGDIAESGFRLRARQLDAIDAATMRKVSEELFEFASLGGLTLRREQSLWAGARMTSPQEAEAALEAANRLESYTAPDTRRALHEVLLQTGIAVPQTLAQWSAALGLLDRVAIALSTWRPEIFSSALAEMVSATGSRGWRKANPDSPGSGDGWWARRTTRKAARALSMSNSRLSKQELHTGLAEVHALLDEWRRVSIDGRDPRPPAGLLEVRSRFDQLTRELAALGAYLTGTDFLSMPTEDLAPVLDSLTGDKQTLRKIPRINELARHFSQIGIEELVTELRNRRVDAQLAAAAFETCWYRSIVERVGFDDPNIANFDGSLQDSIADVFRRSDVEHIAQAAIRVRRAAAERLVHIRDRYGEQSTLVQAQAGRKSGHLALRQLFAAAPDVMTALKPCWAMSPLVVSQLLPGDRPYFDLVVFDEASQIVPADAIPSILRARRVVVAGDQHQLPPTNFFATASDGDDDVEQGVNDDGSINLALTIGYESILDVLTAGLGDGRTRSLTWHYRSRDERLIAFSNAWVYDNSLTTFPGIVGEDCLSHELVAQQPTAAGQEDSVSAEVERVVELVLDHARLRPSESLGVITMGVKHSDRIDARLRERLRTISSLHGFFDETTSEKFFVKNLERVQGDERDAIILSIGYGKTPAGRLPYRFGPLLQDGGDRRLNVAVTRARSRMTLVSSFSHLDMDPNRSSASGVKMLRAYLQYASTHGSSLGEVAMDRPSLNPFEISVRDRLVGAGIPLVAQYGVAGYWIDFAAAHPTQPGRMVLAVEADGASYHSSSTARDRDRLRQDQLERLGWTFHRIWSTDWFSEAETCIVKARMAYTRAVAAADAADAADALAGHTVRETPPIDVVPVSDSPPSSPARKLPRPRVAAGLSITSYSEAQLVAMLRWIESDTLLRTEDQLYDEFRTELGFLRRGSRIQAAFEHALALARRT